MQELQADATIADPGPAILPQYVRHSRHYRDIPIGLPSALISSMTEDILPGTILIRGDALLPRSVEVESHPYSSKWRRVVQDRSALDRHVSDAQWNFFFLAGELKASAFGSGQKAVRRAVLQILTGLEQDQFNCLEFTSTTAARFLGLPSVTVTAHSRHIQESNRLHEPRWTHKIN